LWEKKTPLKATIFSHERYRFFHLNIEICQGEDGEKKKKSGGGVKPEGKEEGRDYGLSQTNG